MERLNLIKSETINMLIVHNAVDSENESERTVASRSIDQDILAESSLRQSFGSTLE